MPITRPAVGSLILTVVITHLDHGRVQSQIAYLEALSPGSRFVVAYGGPREEFARLGVPHAVFVDDPSLRSASTKHQSYNAILRRVHETFIAGDETFELVYFMEFDQLVLRGDFHEALTALSEKTGAGLMAKSASVRNDTNWPHTLAARDDEALNEFIAGISRREDSALRLGCLGTGMLFRRDALAAFCSAAAEAPQAYLELFAPTLVHHLGFEVVDVDQVSDIYSAMRWRPGYAPQEAISAKRAGATFLHPYKGSLRPLQLEHAGLPAGV